MCFLRTRVVMSQSICPGFGAPGHTMFPQGTSKRLSRTTEQFSMHPQLPFPLPSCENMASFYTSTDTVIISHHYFHFHLSISKAKNLNMFKFPVV